VEIHSIRSRCCFNLSIFALFALSQVVSLWVEHLLLVQLRFRTVIVSSGYYFSSIFYAQVACSSFHCRRSCLRENVALIRFINNSFRSGIDEGTPSTVKCSYWLLIVGYIAAISFTMLLMFAINGLDFALTSKLGGLSYTSLSTLFIILYTCGCLLGPSRILNMRTNFMGVIVIGLWVLALFVCKAEFAVYLFVLATVSVRYLYRNYGHAETVPPVVSASGTSYVPPVLVCEAGYGSVHATDNKYKEEVISGVTSTFTSTFSSSSGVPAWREEISVNVYGGRSHKSSGTDYSLLATDESVHCPGDVRR
jgi:hypothetical protein